MLNMQWVAFSALYSQYFVGWAINQKFFLTKYYISLTYSMTIFNPQLCVWGLNWYLVLKSLNVRLCTGTFRNISQSKQRSKGYIKYVSRKVCSTYDVKLVIKINIFVFFYDWWIGMRFSFVFWMWKIQFFFQVGNSMDSIL